eukprot:symbB.v1.2.011948.t1/scaffold813.1/size160256/4
MGFQECRRLVEMLLLQWAWMKTWIDLITNGIVVVQQYPATDARCTAPVIVILAGIILTNVIGFTHFFRKGCFTEAIAAAVDLDTPYLAYKLYPEVLKGDNCLEWEKLRLRNSIWRSLPLAIITFALASRVVVEIPLCQQFATLGPLAVGTFPDLAPDSPFVRDLWFRNGVNPEDIRIFQNVWNRTQELLPSQTREGLQKVAKKSLVLQQRAWAAAHCKDSEWKQVELPLELDFDRWFLGSSHGMSNLAGIEFGGIGSGSMAALNYITHDKWVGFQEEEGEAVRAIRETLTIGLKEVFTSVRYHALNKLAGIRSGRTSKSRQNTTEKLDEHTTAVTDEAQSIQQFRPWKLNVGFHVFQMNDGWKVRLLQTFGLLVVAALPFFKRTLSTSSVHQPVLIFIVGVYTVFDLTCLVSTFVVCASAPVAHHLSTLPKIVVDVLIQFVKERSHEIDSGTDSDRKIMVAMAQLLQTKATGDIDELLTNLIPALQWSLLFFLELAGGSLLFLATSSILACLLGGVGLISSLPTGVCGPLWLLSEESGQEHFHALKERLSLYTLVVSRSLLFAATVGLVWFQVDAFAVESFMALVCNRLISVNVLKITLLVVCVVHCALGLFTTHITLTCVEDAEEDTPDMQFYDHLHKMPYGTFQQPGVQGP